MRQFDAKVVTMTQAEFDGLGGRYQPDTTYIVDGVVKKIGDADLSTGSGSVAVQVPLGISGITAANTARFRAALAATQAGAADTTIGLFGDSNIMGHTTTSTGVRATSWPVQLTRRLRRNFFARTRINGIYGDQNAPVSYPSYDSRLALGTGWSANAGTIQVNGADTGGLGGLFFLGASGAAGSLSITPEVRFDTARIWYTRYAASGTFTVNVDGGAALATVASASATESLSYVDVTCPYGYHTINITGPTGGPAYIEAVEWGVSTESELLIRPFGKYGKRVADFNEASKPWSAKNSMAAKSCNLGIICLVINDSNNATPLATYGSTLQSIVQQQLTVGDAVIMLSAPNGTTAGLNGTYKTYADRAREVAATLGVPVFDVGARWGEYNEANVLGLWADINHPSAATGYPDIAEFVEHGIRALAAAS